MRLSRRHRSTLQETASDGNEPLKQCGRTSIQRVCFKAPSLVNTVNSLCFVPSILLFPSHPLSAWPLPPYGFLSQWVFAVSPTPPCGFFYPNGFFVPSSLPLIFFPVFFQHKAASTGRPSVKNRPPSGRSPPLLFSMF